MAMAFNILKNIAPFFIDNVVTSLGFHKNTKNQILDPITTSVKISLLLYKPLYTKLSINNNRVNFQEPTYILQGLTRRFNGDQRSDINILIQSIKNLLNWYNISDKKVRYICNGVINGLGKLSKCYGEEDENTNLVSQTIGFFIDKIRKDLGELYVPDTNTETYDSTKEDKDSDDDNHSILSDKFMENNIYFEFFKNHWNEREISIIYSQLKELEIDDNDTKRQSIIESIEKFLSYKDDETYKYMISLTKY